MSKLDGYNEKHRVRTHRWKNGRLKIEERHFSNHFEAMAYAESCNTESIKVFDHTGVLVREFSSNDKETYA